jgi:hypothetical protein
VVFADGACEKRPPVLGVVEDAAGWPNMPPVLLEVEGCPKRPPGVPVLDG